MLEPRPVRIDRVSLLAIEEPDWIVEVDVRPRRVPAQPRARPRRSARVRGLPRGTAADPQRIAARRGRGRAVRGRARSPAAPRDRPRRRAADRRLRRGSDPAPAGQTDPAARDGGRVAAGLRLVPRPSVLQARGEGARRLAERLPARGPDVEGAGRSRGGPRSSAFRRVLFFTTEGHGVHGEKSWVEANDAQSRSTSRSAEWISLRGAPCSPW